MSAPLFEKLKSMNRLYPFHMPGHKRNCCFFPENIMDFDITEIPGTDNLHNPTSIIKQSQNLTAQYFNAKQSFFLVNGSSSGIISAVLSICGEHDKILLDRNCHISAYKALILSGAKPVYIFPEITPFGFSGGISPLKIKKALSNDSKIKAVLITSPTYEGICSNIKEIADIVHSFNKILIVDEAHGSHFTISNIFPENAIQSSADIVIQSWHKTLPVPTQCAVLHAQGKLVDYSRLKKSISLIQTTSPSYIFMAMMDKCQELLSDKNNPLFKNYTENLILFREKLKFLKNLYLIDKNMLNHYDIKDIDLSKIVLIINSNTNGKYIEDLLSKKYKIQIEMSGLNHITAITTIADTIEAFENFENSLKEIDSCLEFKKVNINLSEKAYSTFEPDLTPREVFYSESRKINIEDSIGYISAEFIVPYPPGIPILCPGEIIKQDIINELFKYKNSDISITGMEDESLQEINVL